MRSCRRLFLSEPPTVFVSFYPKRNSIGILEKLLNVSFALRGSIPLDFLRAHLYTTIGGAVCKQTRTVGRPHTPIHFVRSQKESRRQSLNSAAPYQTIRALLRHTAYQCELHFRKDLNVVIRLI